MWSPWKCEKTTAVIESGEMPAAAMFFSSVPEVGAPNSPLPTSNSTRWPPTSTISGLNGTSTRSVGRPASASAARTVATGTLRTNSGSASGRAANPSLTVVAVTAPSDTRVTPAAGAATPGPPKGSAQPATPDAATAAPSDAPRARKRRRDGNMSGSPVDVDGSS